MFYPFASFNPDQPAIARGTNAAYNVIPSRGGYRPFADAADFSSNALGARCQGAKGFIASDGNVYVFAGDVDTLYLLKAGATSFSDVSIAAGYTTPAEEFWKFVVYGDRVMATNNTDEIQSYVMGTSTLFSVLQSAAPTCRYLAVAKNFVFALNTETGPDYVQWCAQGDPTDWPTPGTADAISKLSNRVQLAGDGGWIKGAETGLLGADLVIFQERQLVRAAFVGGDQIWQFDVVEGARGCPHAGSIIQIGGTAYYLGEEGFYSYDGMSAQAIGAGKIDKFFLTDSTYGLDTSYTFRMSATSDPNNKCIYWAYPSVSGAADGSCDAILVYSWDVGEFSLVTGVSALEILSRTYAPGYTLEQLDAFGTMETLPYSLDSRFWTGGALSIGGFDTSHTLQAFNGSNLAATLTTVEKQAGGGVRTEITGARPMVEGTSMTLTLTPITREVPSVATSTGSASTMNSRGICKLRSTARYHQLQMGIAAGDTWTQAIGVDVPDEMIVMRGNR